MINLYLSNIIRFIFLVLLQVLILNNIQLGGYINPYLYILVILWLPIELPGWLLLIICFITGITVDSFSGTWGMHTMATLVMGYARPFILKLFSPKDGYEFGTRAVVQDLGFTWFISYSGVLVLIHHFALFYIETFRFGEFFHTFLRMLLSSIFTLLLVVISQFIVYREKSRM